MKDKNSQPRAVLGFLIRSNEVIELHNAINAKGRFIQPISDRKSLCIEKQQFYLLKLNNGDSVSKDNKNLIKLEETRLNPLFVIRNT